MKKEFYIIKEENFEKIRKKVLEIKDQNKTIIFESKDEELIRKVAEKLPVDILLIDLYGKKDKQKQRDSGINEVIARIIQKNGIKIGINFDEIVESPIKEKTNIIARIKQNVRICNKNKIEMTFIIQKKENQKNIYDLKSLAITLGMPTWMVSKI